MAKRFCEIDDCGEEISEGTGSHGGLAICPRCRGVQSYWKKKGPKEIAARKERLVFWEHRLDYLHPHIVKMLADAERRVDKAKHSARKAA